GGGGSISGSIELLTLAEIEQWEVGTRPWIRETWEGSVTELPFRTSAWVQSGLGGYADAVPRTWNG
ncbi:MAG: hypothetical protein ACK5MT_10180, partial [Actinomycetales bacterium]